MRFLPVLALAGHIALVFGSPDAEAAADPQWDQQKDGEVALDSSTPAAMPLSMSPDNDMAKYQGNQMQSSSYRSWSSQGYKPGNAGQYARPWPPVQRSYGGGVASSVTRGYQPNSVNMYTRTLGYPVTSSGSGMQYGATSVGKYGSLTMSETGNAQALSASFSDPSFAPGTFSRPDTNYPLNPSSNGRPSISYPLNPPTSYPLPRPNTNLPLNSQGLMYTRSYTPLSNGCTSVCNQRRPMINQRPVCRTSCSQMPVRPSCSMTKPNIDYQVQGPTTMCKPKPLINPLPIQMTRPCYYGNCGSASSGGSSGIGFGGYNPGQGYPVQNLPGSTWGGSVGCSGGGCGVQSSPCSSGGCGSSSGGYQQAVNLPQPINGNLYYASATAPREPIPQGWRAAASTVSGDSQPCVGSGCGGAASGSSFPVPEVAVDPVPSEFASSTSN